MFGLLSRINKKTQVAKILNSGNIINKHHKSKMSHIHLPRIADLNQKVEGKSRETNSINFMIRKKITIK